MARYPEDFDCDSDFHDLRLSALMQAVEISPYVKCTTIGPNSSYREGEDNEETPEFNKKNIVNGDHKKVDCNGSSKPNNYLSDYTYEILVHECEQKQKETTELVFKNMISKMVAKRAEYMTNFLTQQELDYQKRAKQRRDKEIEMLNEWELDDQASRIEMERMDEQNKAYLQRMKKSLEKQLEQVNMLDTLNNNHSTIVNKIIEIKNVTSENKDINDRVFQKHEYSLQNIQNSIEILMEKSKSGIISSEDVEKSTILCNQISKLKDTILIEMQTTEKVQIQKINDNEIENKAIKPESPVKEEAIVPETIVKPKYVSDPSLKLFEETIQFLKEYEQNYQPLLDDPSLKSYRFDCQKAVNTPVNAISSVSSSHIKDKYDKLYKLLNGDSVSIGNSTISASRHPLGKAYCTNLLAKKIVRQGDSTVSSNPEAAFPIASVTIALWSKFPDFGKLLMGHFYRECPYLVPMLMPQFKDQPDEDYYRVRGYVYTEDGTVEKQDKFLKRMTGIFRLMASIWVTSMPRVANAPHPQHLSCAWRWMAAFLNLEPERDISATLIFDFLTVCGEDFLKYYGVQFQKVIQFLATDYTRMLDAIDEGGPKTRLTVFIQKVFKEKKIPPPSGKLKDFFW